VLVLDKMCRWVVGEFMCEKNPNQYFWDNSVLSCMYILICCMLCVNQVVNR